MRFDFTLFLSLLFLRLYMGECARKNVIKLERSLKSTTLRKTKFNIHWAKLNVSLFSENEVKEKEEALSKWNVEFQENFQEMVGYFLNTKKKDLPESYSKLTFDDLKDYSEISLLDATFEYIRKTDLAFGTLRGRDLARFLTPSFEDLRRDEERSEAARTAYFERSRKKKSMRKDLADPWQPWWNETVVWLPFAYARYESLSKPQDKITLKLRKTNELFNKCAKIIRILRFYEEQAKRAEEKGSHVRGALTVLQSEPLATFHTQGGVSTHMALKRKASEGLGSIHSPKAQPEAVNESSSIDKRVPPISSAFQVLLSHSDSQPTFSKHTEGVPQQKSGMTPLHKIVLAARPASSERDVRTFLEKTERVFQECIGHMLRKVDESAANEDFSPFYEKCSVTRTNAEPLVEVTRELLHRIQKKDPAFAQVNDNRMATVLKEGLDKFILATKEVLLVFPKLIDMNRPSSKKDKTPGNGTVSPSPREPDQIIIELPKVSSFFNNRGIRDRFKFFKDLRALQAIYLKHHYYRQVMASLQSESSAKENV